MVSSALSYPALARAAENTKPPPASSSSATGGESLKNMRQFSEAGHSAMMDIGDARLAIFDGNPKMAMKMMEMAKTYLSQADKDASSMNAATPSENAKPGVNAKPGATNEANPRIRSVPVDGQLALADDFVMTPEKKMHVDKANESFKKGDHAAGLEELKLGAIDVNYTRWWLPIAPTESHLDQAIKLANESKYYEANLALKAIQDSVTMDSVSFSDLPSGNKSAS